MVAGVGGRVAFDVVVVAAFQGGLAAYQPILAGLPPEFPAAVVVVVVQHRAARQWDVLGRLLARGTELVVEPAQVGCGHGRVFWRWPRPTGSCC